MRTFIATVAFATAITSPALAQQIGHQDVDVSVPQAQLWVEPAPSEAFATVIVPGPAPAPVIVRRNPFEVYSSSGYAGADPDPRIREDLQRDNPYDRNDD